MEANTERHYRATPQGLLVGVSPLPVNRFRRLALGIPIGSRICRIG